MSDDTGPEWSQPGRAVLSDPNRTPEPRTLRVLIMATPTEEQIMTDIKAILEKLQELTEITRLGAPPTIYDGPIVSARKKCAAALPALREAVEKLLDWYPAAGLSRDSEQGRAFAAGYDAAREDMVEFLVDGLAPLKELLEDKP